MTFDEAKRKLAEYSQEKVLTYFDELDEKQKEQLLNPVSYTHLRAHET